MPTILLWAAAMFAAPDTTRFGPEDVNSLPPATTQVDQVEGLLTIELPLVEIPGNGMLRTPVHRAEVPFDVSLHGFRVEVVSESGVVLPQDRLHHFNLTDPDRRELFAPLPLHIMAASKETPPSPSVPSLLIGMPLPAGRRYIAYAMLANPEDHAVKLRARLVFNYIRPGRVFPLIRAYPWVMDVMFPLGGEGGRKDFDLPPGRSSRSWESSPAVPGTIIGLGGHLHDLATAIELRDVTSGEIVWRQEPVRDENGKILSLPTEKLYRWYRLGIHIEPSHVYRVTVFYDNPTGEMIPYGGMGAVAGLFRPDAGVRWPGVDRDDPVYRVYVDNILRNMQGLEMGHGAHAHHRPE
jgi:hypothetical protein